MEDTITQNTSSAIVVQDRSSLTGANSSDMELLAKLDEKLRFIEQKKINASDPTYYLTLNEVSVANAMQFVASLKKVTDIQNGGKNRVAYLYPILISQHSKPAFQLFLFYPPKNKVGVRDAGPLRRAAISKSEPLLRSLLEAKRSRPTEIDEEDPGAGLIKLDATRGVRFYPDYFSLEYDLRRMLKKNFDRLQLPYIDIPDFFEDIEEFFSRSTDIVERVGEKYHIVIDQLVLDENGNYARTPEVIRHYRLLADGLEKFAFNILLEKAKKAGAGASAFVSSLENYRAQHVLTAEPGRKQNKEKVEALMRIVREYPFDRIQDKENAMLRKSINDVISWLTLLITKKDRLVERKQRQSADNLLQKIENLIQSNTKQNLDLFQIDLRREILRTVKDEAQAMAMENDFEKRLTTRYGSYKVSQGDGSGYFYFVDQKYISSVLENLSRVMKIDSSATERFEIANKIFDQLVKRKDPALDQGLSTEERIHLSQMKTYNLNEVTESKRIAMRANRYNIPQGVLVSLILTIFFVAAMFYSTQLFWLIFPFVLISVISFYRLGVSSQNKNRTVQEETLETVESTTDKAAVMKETQQSIVRQKIASYGSTMVFPFSPQKQSERILTEEEFRAKVKMATPEIKRNVPELASLDGRALEEAAYEALREDAVCIVIPTDIV
ncbi:MAG TPA: hypothetical protein PLY93_03055, partial [Turneriella sp.]|nr:hypothetical protein [Turneriella sp.]